MADLTPARLPQRASISGSALGEARPSSGRTNRKLCTCQPNFTCCRLPPKAQGGPCSRRRDHDAHCGRAYVASGESDFVTEIFTLFTGHLLHKCHLLALREHTPRARRPTSHLTTRGVSTLAPHTQWRVVTAAVPKRGQIGKSLFASSAHSSSASAPWPMAWAKRPAADLHHHVRIARYRS